MITPEEMTPAAIYEYQMSIEEWQPKTDVTMKHFPVDGLVDDCVKIANRAIERVISG